MEWLSTNPPHTEIADQLVNARFGRSYWRKKYMEMLGHVQALTSRERAS